MPDVEVEKVRSPSFFFFFVGESTRSKKFNDRFLIKAVDKIGRTARRTIDTHIKNVLSKPRVATTMRRMTAMFNFSADLRMLPITFP